MQRRFFTFLCVLVFFSGCLGLQAKVSMPGIFTENMVLQRDQAVKVWGWADAGEKIEVTFNGQKLKTKANKQGKWTVQLKPMAFGGPYVMNIKGKNNTISLDNILIGDIWLCSGQSNMEWVVSNSANAAEEIINANYPLIRSFNVVKDVSISQKDNLEGAWQICSPATVGNFSAVAYFFARNLHQELNVPIGIINSSWGGTDIETWISPSTFSQLPPLFSERYKGKVSIDNFNEFVEKNNIAQEAYYKALTNESGIREGWYKPEHNTSSWEEMTIPQLWENVLGDVDGIIWFTYDFDLPKEFTGKPAKLFLGVIDDDDITWINGRQVGETIGYAEKRIYDIPDNLLKEGKNTITVRVADGSGGGGLYGKPEELFVFIDGYKQSLAGNWKYKQSVTNTLFNYVNISPNMVPSLLYNAMINPIIDFGIKGSIWYQGENNAWDATNYQTLFPTMIRDWRAKWGYDFPFYWVQLANFMAKDNVPVDSDWARLREAQTMTQAVSKTGQAVIVDIGEADDIHPRNKQDVGRRLALIALNKEYGKSDVVYSGPTFKSLQINGDKAIIDFDHIADGLVVDSKYGYIEGFAVAGNDKKFHWAKAYKDGNDKIVVYCKEVPNPVAVRYGWSNNPDMNLYNSAGLPACPFRTDNW